MPTMQTGSSSLMEVAVVSLPSERGVLCSDADDDIIPSNRLVDDEGLGGESTVELSIVWLCRGRGQEHTW